MPTALRNANLNLIPILQALLKEESVTVAARSLGLSQPAVSAALARLRLELDDPLLIQVGKTMRRSQRAQSLLPQLDKVCSDIEAVLKKPSFDPFKAKRTFTIAAPDYLAFPVSRFLLDRLKREAPDVGLRFVDMPASLTHCLLAREIDVGVGVKFADRWPDLLMVTGYWNEMVAIVRHGHPLADLASASASDFEKYPKVAFGGALDFRPVAERESSQADPKIAFDQWMTLPFLVAGSDAVAIVPISLAKEFQVQAALSILPNPQGLITRNTGILWSEVQDSDPAHQWLRGLLKDALGALLGDPRTAYGAMSKPAKASPPRAGRKSTRPAAPPA